MNLPELQTLTPHDFTGGRYLLDHCPSLTGLATSVTAVARNSPSALVSSLQNDLETIKSLIHPLSLAPQGGTETPPSHRSD